MLGKLIVALLIIGAAAAVTLQRDEADAAGLTAAIAESKFDDIEKRAQDFEKRAQAAELLVAASEARIKKLETEIERLKRGPTGAEDAFVVGPLSAEIIEGVLEKNRAQLGGCWLLAGEESEGTLTLRWVIEGDGKAHLTRAEGARGEELDVVAQCLQKRIDTMVFPASKKPNGFTVVRWPFAYDAGAFEPQPEALAAP